MLVSGAPGTGKSFFGWQFSINSATNEDEPGVFVTLEERPEDIRRNLKNFCWDIASLEAKKR